jgi:putative phosphoribosyl transferase
MVNPSDISMTPVSRFRDRKEAGKALARSLGEHYRRPHPLVLALPRGGVPVGREIAQALHIPLDVFVVRKIAMPEQTEVAIGALATGSVQLLDDALIEEAKIPASMVSFLIVKDLELQRREDLYRGGRPPPEISERSVILVDDGVATGYTMRVAILALKKLNPAHVTVAIPVGAPETCKTIEGLVDELICLAQPSPLHAVGLWYDHFPPVTDAEVREGIAEASHVTDDRSAR